MTTYAFKVGATCSIDGRRYCIVRILDGGRVYLEALDDGSLTEMTRDDLLARYASKALSFERGKSSPSSASTGRGRPLATYPERIQKQAIRKKQYLDLLDQAGMSVSSPERLQPFIAECALLLKDPSPPSPSSIYRWQQKLRSAGGDTRSLIDRYEARGRGARIEGAVIALLHEVIDSEYLVSERRSLNDIFHALLDRIERHNEQQPESSKLRMPSISTVYRMMRSVDAFDLMAAKKGRGFAKRKFMTALSAPRPSRILERVEIDHTPLDLFVVDEQTNLPLGRPCVTVALDTYSRMVVGFHVGFEGPSVAAVLRCLRHSILPKTYVKSRYPDINHDWPCHGQFLDLVCDNGLEFHGDQLARVAHELGMHLVFCPPRKPWLKGKVERFLKTLNYQFAHSLPGTSFAKWFQRDDYNPLQHALITHDQLMHLLHRWVIDIYSQSLHRGIDSTPYQKWTEGTKQYLPMLPLSAADLDISIGTTHTRVLSHQGIEYGNLFYNHESLLAIRKRYGERVTVDVIAYFDDVATIAVLDPETKEPILVPAVDQQYACGLTREQHRMLCARARETAIGAVDHRSLARAKAEIRELITEMAISKRQRRRQKSAKVRGVGTNAPDLLSSNTKEQPSPLSESFQTRGTSPSELPKLKAFSLRPPPSRGER